MTRKCAWCGKELGSIPPLDDLLVTHGICQECSDLYLHQGKLVDQETETPRKATVPIVTPPN